MNNVFKWKITQFAFIDNNFKQKRNKYDKNAHKMFEVPCEYIFEGDNFSCEWLHRKLIEEKFDAKRCLAL